MSCFRKSHRQQARHESFSQKSVQIISALLFAGLALSAAPAAAQDYPTRPITAIVPFAPGGPVDTITRIVGEHMSRTLGQPIVIENVAGAGGTTGSARAMRATPDGYTIMTGHMGTHAAAVGLYPDLAYDPRTDFEPLALLAGTPTLIYARKDFPPATLTEFVAYAKANADKLNVAHAGVGSVAHATCTLLNSILGIKPTMVPYNGGAPALNALVAGQVDYMCDQIINGMAQVQAGQIKAYAIATPKRHPLLPNIPTTAEAGLPAYQASAWNAMFAPKGTRKAVLDTLNAAIVKALDDDNVRKRLLDIGSDIPDAAGRTPAALASLVRSEIDKWTPILKAATAGR
jgi:putative tricarboxylic transport membrane protein